MMTGKISRRRFLELAAATAAGGILLPACQAGQKAEEQPAEPTPAPVTPEPVTITMWTPHPLEDNIRITEFLTGTFLQQNPDINFEFTRVPEEWEQKFKTAAAGKTLPDIFAVDGINVPTFASRGLLAELDESVIAPDVLEDFFPPARAEMQFRGKTYATTLETNSQALRVNVEIMRDAGVEPPETWDDLIQIGKKITTDTNGNHPGDTNFDPESLARGTFETWCCLGEGSTWMILPWIWMNGGETYDADTKKVKIADPEAIEAIQFLSDLVKVHYVWPKSGVLQAGPEGTFYGQLVALSATGAYDLAWLTVDNPPEFEWDISPFPRPKDGKFISGVGGWMMCAWKEGQHLAQTAKFMTFTVGDTWQEHVSINGRRTIAERRLAEIPQLKIFLEAMEGGRARPRSTQYPLITEALQQAFDESIFGDRPAAEALADAAPKIEDALNKEEAE
jgi:ABC-type glycerol-3-phosphate transport system substrate-binding protein